MPRNVKIAVAPLAKRVLRRTVPLPLRKRLAIAIGRSEWMRDRYYWSMEVIRDLAERDPDAFHRFLWAHHLAYAQTYEADRRFTAQNLHPSRRLLFGQLQQVMTRGGIDPCSMRSVLDVGCSLGYLLRHLETELLPGATVLHGIDLDGPAIEAGAHFLAEVGSRVRLARGDMAELDTLLGGTTYDVVLCAGTLMYLNERAASAVVDSMVRRTKRLLVLSGPANPDRDNREMDGSGVRARDHSFVHNLDAMVEAAGGTVVARRWEGDRSVAGNTIYFVFAEPPAGDGRLPGSASYSGRAR